MHKTIAYIISSYDIYGAAKVVFNEVKALRSNGDKVTLVLLWPNCQTPFIDKITKENIHYFHLISNWKFDFLAIFKLIRFLNKNKVDLVHSNGYKPDVIGLIACRILRVPIVTTVHGWCSEDLKVCAYEKLQLFCWRFFDGIICVSESYKAKILKSGIAKNKVSVIPNGISVDDCGPTRIDNKKQLFLKQYNIPFSHLVIGIIGRLSIEKGHRYFIEAAANILKQNSDISFVIVGDGPEKKSIQRLINDLGLNKRFYSVGYVENMKQTYAALDIVVIPSLREGLPNVLLEAMFYEKPVIASNVGGIPEVISDKEDGLLVMPQDSLAIADALLNLIRSPGARKKIGLAAKEKVIKQFNFNDTMTKIQEVYKKVTQDYRNN